MVEVKYEVNGRRVAPHDFGNAMTRAALEHVGTQVRRKLESVRCPEHRQRPRVTIASRPATGMSFSVQGCCDQLIERAKRTLQ